MDKSEHFPSLSQISLSNLNAKSLFQNFQGHVVNGKILNQLMKFPLLCQFLIQGEVPKLLLNLSCGMDLHAPFFFVMFWTWILHSIAVSQLLSLCNKFSLKFCMDHPLKCLPCPSIFSSPMPPLKLWCSLNILLSSDDASPLQDPVWMLEEGAHCFDVPEPAKVGMLKTEVL